MIRVRRGEKSVFLKWGKKLLFLNGTIRKISIKSNRSSKDVKSISEKTIQAFFKFSMEMDTY